MRITESVPEMGAPYPQHRGGTRVLSSPHAREAAPDDHTVIHPWWPPRLKWISDETIRKAREFDRLINEYNRN